VSKQTKITKSAKGKDCQVRVIGICSYDNEKTVYAHLNGGGIGMKSHDIHGAYACFECHQWLDGGYVEHLVLREKRDLIHLEAVVRTQAILLSEGLISVS